VAALAAVILASRHLDDARWLDQARSELAAARTETLDDPARAELALVRTLIAFVDKRENVSELSGDPAIKAHLEASFLRGEHSRQHRRWLQAREHFIACEAQTAGSASRFVLAVLTHDAKIGALLTLAEDPEMGAREKTAARSELATATPAFLGWLRESVQRVRSGK
jgi:hypothetical protein